MNNLETEPEDYKVLGKVKQYEGGSMELQACKSHNGINNSLSFLFHACSTSLPHQTNTHTHVHTTVHRERSVE